MKRKSLTCVFKPMPFEFDGQFVRTEGELVCLTDLWRAAGEPKGKDSPRDWRRRAGKQFIVFVAKFLNGAPIERILQVRLGRNGGIFGHWQLGLAYAKYLSHELHMHVNEIYMRYAGGDLKLAEEIFDKTPEAVEAQKKSAARIHGKVVRNEHTQTLLEHGVTRAVEFAMCTDATYQGLFGGTTRQLKQERGLMARESLRDEMDLVEISAVFLAEALADRQIRDEDLYGFNPCKKSCYGQARKVHSIL